LLLLEFAVVFAVGCLVRTSLAGHFERMIVMSFGQQQQRLDHPNPNPKDCQYRCF
jgi:hypothetical protein